MIGQNQPVNDIIFNMKIFVFLSLFLLTGCLPGKQSQLIFRKMLVEYAENPNNIDKLHPRLSWIVTSTGRNHTQSAYRILVSSSQLLLSGNEGDLWDSGIQNSSETIQHEYSGQRLISNQKYFWKAIIWDEKGIKYESPFSTFETTALSSGDWKASWIGYGPASEVIPEKGFYADQKEQYIMKDTINHSGRSLLLRKEVLVPKKVMSARAMITGLGFYEFFINGTRVGDNVLSPAKTPYHKYILYDTFDVTDLLKEGRNVFGIHLGNGWYNPYKKWWRQYRIQWFGSKKAIAQVTITFEDGSSMIVTTDEDWRCSEGPVIYNCIYDGEVKDSNLEQTGWMTTGFNDSAWKQVTIYSNVKARLVSQRMPPVKINETIKPSEVKVSVSGMKVFDMGQNFAGWVRIKATGKRETKLKIRFAEDIHADGTIDISSNENALATAEYIMNGEGVEVYEPAFTYFGFRYIEITSENGPFKLINVEGRVVYSRNTRTGQFVCDDTLVNKIHNATVWSQKSNMIGYPMDCPQRDERLGWLGDAQVTAEEAMYNFDMALFYENWFEGIKENQDEETGDIPIISPQPYMPDEGVEWSSTYIIMLWQYYTNYGDKIILASHYNAMKKYMQFLHKKAKNYIIPKGWIGDWGSLVKGWKEGQPESVPTAYYFLNSLVMSKIASVLGNLQDQTYYSNLADTIRNIYNKKYFNFETASYLEGNQMDNAFPLYLGIVPDSLKSSLIQNLVNDIVIKNDTHLTTGVLGTKYMPEALAKSGKAGIVWDLINQKSYPSWNEMMKKYTTTCEFWTLKQSKNHVMMGSIDAWFYKYIAGIQPDENYPAYFDFKIKPFIPEGLNFANAKIETLRGTIYSGWKKEPGKLILKVEVPFNTSALITIPGEQSDSLSEGGLSLNKSDEVDYTGYSEGSHQVRVHSGKYEIQILQDSQDK